MANKKRMVKSPNKDCVACGRCCWKDVPACALKHLTRVGKKYYCDLYKFDDFPKRCVSLNNFDLGGEPIEEWWTGCRNPEIGGEK